MIPHLLTPTLTRIADALERLSPLPQPATDIHACDAFIWSGERQGLIPVEEVQHVPLAFLHGIEHISPLLLQNTAQFAQGLPANNALLWGARGMGKSSLVKAVHAEINKTLSEKLALIEIYRDELASLSHLLKLLRATSRRFILFCDDLSFHTDDASYKSLKALLDGGIEGRPANVVFYATSNRRHLMPREMVDNEQGSAIHPAEAVEEKLSLSDRFGLWLGFHSCSQDNYLEMVSHYARHLALPLTEAALHHAANEWSITRGARSGRVAWQFIQDMAGKMGIAITITEESNT